MDDDSPGPPAPNIGVNREVDEIDKEIQRLQALKARHENQQPTVVRGMVSGNYSTMPNTIQLTKQDPNQPNLPEANKQHYVTPGQYNNPPSLQVFLLAHKLLKTFTQFTCLGSKSANLASTKHAKQ